MVDKNKNAQTNNMSENNNNKWFKKYQQINNQLQSMKNEQKSIKIESQNKFLQKLQIISEQNNYIIYEKFGQDPKIVLIGDIHPDNSKSIFYNEISEILKQTLNETDNIYLEGPTNGKIIQGLENLISIPVSKIADLVKQKKINVYFSDNKKLVSEQAKYETKVKKTKDAADIKLNDDPDSDVSELLNKHINYASKSLKVMKERDLGICHCKFGLINASKKEGRSYQIIGAAHIFSRDITNILKENKISYAIIMPKKVEYEK